MQLTRQDAIRISGITSNKFQFYERIGYIKPTRIGEGRKPYVMVSLVDVVMICLRDTIKAIAPKNCFDGVCDSIRGVLSNRISVVGVVVSIEAGHVEAWNENDICFDFDSNGDPSIGMILFFPLATLLPDELLKLITADREPMDEIF